MQVAAATSNPIAKSKYTQPIMREFSFAVSW
jgi:hypothetical protein